MSTWIQCFKAGTQTDSKGEGTTYTVEDLNTMVKVYKEALEANPNGSAKAPLCKGHGDDTEIKDSDPAYGWVDDLKVEDDILMALVDPVKDFAEEVNQGKFKKVSISHYPDFMLRHIAFLGAAAPAVKGLDPVQFSRTDKYKTVFFAEAPTAQTPVSQTVDAFIAEQEARAKKFGIGVKDKIGYVQKPNAYSALTDEQFGDPVNYLYPINDLPNLLASVATWSNWDNSYTAVEKQVVMTRIYTAAQALQLTIEPEHGIRLYKEGGVKSFLEIPIDKLSKSQLTDYIVSSIEKDNSTNNFINNSGLPMNTIQEWLTACVADLVAKETARVNAEAGSSLQADFDAFLTANPLPGDTASTDPGADPNATPAFAEPTKDPTVLALEAKIAELERVNRTAQFTEYAKSKVTDGTLTPAIMPIAIAALEFGHNAKSVMNFSEGNKAVELKGSNAVKRLIDALPKNALTANFGEGRKPEEPKATNFSAPKGADVDEIRADGHNAIIKIQNEKKCSYTEALNIYANGGN